MSHFSTTKQGHNDADFYPPPAMRLGPMDTSLNSTGIESTGKMDEEPNNFPSSTQVLDYLWRSSASAEQNIKPPPHASAGAYPKAAVAPQLVSPAMARGDRKPATEIQQFIDSRELRRNVKVHLETKRSYVYTLDLIGKNLPELLWLDLPSSKFAASLCGRHLTNAIVKQMLTDIKNVGKKASLRQSDLKVFSQAVAMPFGQDGTARRVVVRFRLRYVRKGTKLHHHISWNFFGGRTLPHGVMIFIPSFTKKSAFGTLWGHTEDVDPIPDRDAQINRELIDGWISEIAEVHGLYAGEVPKAYIPPRELAMARAAAEKAAAYSQQSVPSRPMKTGKLVACTVHGKNMFPSRFKIYTHKL